LNILSPFFETGRQKIGFPTQYPVDTHANVIQLIANLSWLIRKSAGDTGDCPDKRAMIAGLQRAERERESAREREREKERERERERESERASERARERERERERDRQTDRQTDRQRYTHTHYI
jgi:hypothetical protein